MFDPQEFVQACRQALDSEDPQARVAALLRAALADPEGMRQVLEAEPMQGAVRPLFRSPELTIAHVATAPGSVSPIHNHCMWGVIGMFAGQEDNHLYTRAGAGLDGAGTRVLRRGDVFEMDPNLIHAVENPLDVPNGGLHIYGGDLMERPGRSLWDPDSGEEVPYQFERVLEFTSRLSG